MEYVSGNIFIRPNKFTKAGDTMEGHTHNFDHTTFVTRGSFNALGKHPDGREVRATVSAGQHLLIRADWEHSFVALEDNSEFACIYAHRTPQGDVVQEVTGWMEAYL